MKQVKNRSTGDIGELDFDSKEGVFIVVCYDLSAKITTKHYYKTLKNLNKEWEDYTEEEAEKAVEKLKAWKRLKDNGFKFTAYQLQELNIKFFLDHGYTKMGDDLDLLFGGEE